MNPYENLKQKLVQEKVIFPNLTKIKKSANLKESTSLFNEVIQATSWIEYSACITTRLICIIKNYIHQPKCPICNSPIKLPLSGRKRYAFPEFCSSKCRMSSSEVHAKIKENIKAKYGVDNISQLASTKDKVKDTNIRVRGVSHSLSCPKIRQQIEQTNLRKYGNKTPLLNEEIRQKINQTNLERYGTITPSSNEYVREKQKNTCLERYGVEYPMQSDKIHDKCRETFLEKYGVDSPMKDSAILLQMLEKSKQSNMEKYGVEYPMQSKEVRDISDQIKLEKYGDKGVLGNIDIQQKIRKNNMEKYGTQFPSQRHFSPETIVKINDYQWMYDQLYVHNKSVGRVAEELGISAMALGKHYQRHNIKLPLRTTSQCERDVVSWIESFYEKEIKTNVRDVINPKELDIYLPQDNLAIEVNGFFYHSLEGSEGRINKDYHLHKTNECGNKGIDLIHIFDYEWNDKPDVVKMYIKNALNIYPQDISHQIYSMSTSSVSTFIDHNSLISAPFDSNLSILVNGKIHSTITYILFKHNIIITNISETTDKFVSYVDCLINNLLEAHKSKTMIFGIDNRFAKCLTTLMNRPLTVITTTPPQLCKSPYYDNLSVWDCGSVAYLIM